MTGILPHAPNGTDGQWSPDRSWAAGDALLTQPLDLRVVQAVVEPTAAPRPARPSRLGVGLAVLGALLALWPAWETVGLVRFNLGDEAGVARYAFSGGLTLLAVVLGCVAATVLVVALARRWTERGTRRATLLLGVAVAVAVLGVALDGALLVADGVALLDALTIELGWDSFNRLVTWWVVLADASVAVWAVAVAVLVTGRSRTPRHAPGGAPGA